jgi:hypothetical protein
VLPNPALVDQVRLRCACRDGAIRASLGGVVPEEQDVDDDRDDY